MVSRVKNRLRKVIDFSNKSYERNSDTIEKWINIWVRVEYRLGLYVLKHIVWVIFLSLSVIGFSMLVDLPLAFLFGFFLMLFVLGGFTNVLSDGFTSLVTLLRLVLQGVSWFRFSGSILKLSWIDRIRAFCQGFLLSGVGLLGLWLIVENSTFSFWLNLIVIGIVLISLGLLIGAFLAGDEMSFFKALFFRSCTVFMNLFILPIGSFFVWVIIVGGELPELVEQYGAWVSLIGGFFLLGITLVGSDFLRFLRLGSDKFGRWRIFFAVFLTVLYFHSTWVVEWIRSHANVVDKPLEMVEFDGFKVESFCRGEFAWMRVVFDGDVIELSERDPLRDNDCVSE